MTSQPLRIKTSSSSIQASSSGAPAQSLNISIKPADLFASHRNQQQQQQQQQQQRAHVFPATSAARVAPQHQQQQQQQQQPRQPMLSQQQQAHHHHHHQQSSHQNHHHHQHHHQHHHGHATAHSRQQQQPVAPALAHAPGAAMMSPPLGLQHHGMPAPHYAQQMPAPSGLVMPGPIPAGLIPGQAAPLLSFPMSMQPVQANGSIFPSSVQFPTPSGASTSGAGAAANPAVPFYLNQHLTAQKEQQQKEAAKRREEAEKQRQVGAQFFQFQQQVKEQNASRARNGPPAPAPAPASMNSRNQPPLQIIHQGIQSQRKIVKLDQLADEVIAWCKQALQALTGVPDLSLVEFLLTVESDEEAKSYALHHLGESNSSISFIDQFLMLRNEPRKANVNETRSGPAGGKKNNAKNKNKNKNGSNGNTGGNSQSSASKNANSAKKKGKGKSGSGGGNEAAAVAANESSSGGKNKKSTARPSKAKNISKTGNSQQQGKSDSGPTKAERFAGASFEVSPDPVSLPMPPSSLSNASSREPSSSTATVSQKKKSDTESPKEDSSNSLLSLLATSSKPSKNPNDNNPLFDLLKRD